MSEETAIAIVGFSVMISLSGIGYALARIARAIENLPTAIASHVSVRLVKAPYPPSKFEEK